MGSTMADQKTMGLSDLQAFLAKIEDHAGRDALMREAFESVGTAVADILELLEKQGPEQIKAIAEALKGIKLAVEMKAPEVRINVQPTPVEVNPVINLPAPVVTLQTSGKGWKFSFETDRQGNVSGCTALRI